MRATLERIADRCRRGLELDPADRMALAIGLGGWLSGSYSTLDAAFGVKRQPGERTNKTVRNTRERDALIRRLAAEHYSQHRYPAGVMARDLTRYRTTAWRADKQKRDTPANYAGTSREGMFLIMRCGAPPDSPRQIRRILQDDSPDMN